MADRRACPSPSPGQAGSRKFQAAAGRGRSRECLGARMKMTPAEAASMFYDKGRRLRRPRCSTTKRPPTEAALPGSLPLFHSGELPAAVGADMNAGVHALCLGGPAQLDSIPSSNGNADARGGVGAAGVRDRAPGQVHPGSVRAPSVRRLAALAVHLAGGCRREIRRQRDAGYRERQDDGKCPHFPLPGLLSEHTTTGIAINKHAIPSQLGFSEPLPAGRQE
jgi:hypothetical protein